MKSAKERTINNEVLRQLWNDPDVRELTESVKGIMPDSIAEDELVIDYDHLVNAGYIGKPPYFHLRIGRFLFYRAAAFYSDFWIRLKMPRGRKNSLYSLFKESASRD